MEYVFNHAITSVKVFPSSRYGQDFYKIKDNYKLFTGRKYLIIPIYKIIPKAVIVDLFGESFVSTVEDFKHSEFEIKDDEIFYKPHCEIKLNNGNVVTKYFVSVERLNIYVDSLKSKADHITIV